MRNRHDLFRAVERGCNSYPVAPVMTFIPAKAGIHCRRNFLTSDHKPSTGLRMTGRVYVAVVGSGAATDELYEKARTVGRLVAQRGATVVCGGLSGVMEAAARGATEAGGTAVGILPDEDRRRQNEYLTYSVATGAGTGEKPCRGVLRRRCHRRRRRVRYALGDRSRQEGRTARGGPGRLGSRRARDAWRLRRRRRSRLRLSLSDRSAERYEVGTRDREDKRWRTVGSRL